MLFAASFPERVQGLVLYGTAARFGQSHDYPFGIPEAAQPGLIESIDSFWGTGLVFGGFIQHAADQKATQEFLARFERNACTRKMAVEIMRRNLEIDVRPMLSTITAPTRVIHVTGDPVVKIESARYVAEHIPGAELVELPGDFHASWRADNSAGLRDSVIDFVSAGATPVRSAERVLVTVMFTDIVSSTERAADLGDADWHWLLDQHDRIARTEIERLGGRLVSTTGDGVLATFDGPSHGIACAGAIAGALRAHNLPIRGGVHTGEVEIRGDDVAGLGIVIARRICDLADSGQVLVSRTVKDLIAGSGIELHDHGTHVLKGVPDDWQLFAVA